MKNLLTFYYALKDQRTPWYAKLTALLSIIYLLSPADIVPDIIPFAGYIDDIVIVPFLINVSTQLLPAQVRQLAEQRATKNKKKLLWMKIAVIVVAIGLMALLFYLGTLLYQYIKDAF
jgi:uncharacterized membrane protein YkvA (DUF1232 family)